MRRLMQTTIALPCKDLQALLEMGHDVLSYLFNPLLRPDHRLQLRPLRFQLLPTLDLSPSVASSNSGSIFGFSCSSRASLARRLS